MVCTISDNSDRLEVSAKTGTKVSTKSCAMEHMRNILCTWIEDCNQCHAPVSKVLRGASRK